MIARTSLPTGLILALMLPAAARAEDTPKPKPKPKLVDYEAELNDKLAKGIQPEQNVCAGLWKFFGPHPEGAKMPAEYFKRLGIEQPPEKGEYFISLGTILKDELQLPQEDVQGILNQQSWTAARPWSDKDYPVIALWLTKNEKPLAVAHEALKRMQYYNPLVSKKNDKGNGSLIGALLPSVQKCRELASALCARAMLRLHEGKVDAAWDDLLACHRLARFTGRGATLIEGLVGYAIEAIASNSTLAYIDHANLSTKQIEFRVKNLANLPPLASIADKIDLGERYMYLDSLNMLRRGDIKLLEGLSKDVPSEAERKKFAELDWAPAIANGNKWYDYMAAALRRPTRAERVQALTKIEKELKDLQSSGNFTDAIRIALGNGELAAKRISDTLLTLLVPAVRKVNDAHDRTVQIHANLTLAFALAAYRSDNKRYPAKLDDLAPQYVAKVPADLFSGLPLIYKPGEKGYLLYSIGVNGKDDEGRYYDDVPRGDDIRVRMPLPPLKKD